jgi:hypothetical protein
VAVRGIDVARPLREPDLGRRLLALGKHGVLPLSLVGYKASALTYASTHDGAPGVFDFMPSMT